VRGRGCGLGDREHGRKGEREIGNSDATLIKLTGQGDERCTCVARDKRHSNSHKYPLQSFVLLCLLSSLLFLADFSGLNKLPSLLAVFCIQSLSPQPAREKVSTCIAHASSLRRRQSTAMFAVRHLHLMIHAARFLVISGNMLSLLSVHDGHWVPALGLRFRHFLELLRPRSILQSNSRQVILL
jgi:hypothetical protein